MKMKKMKWALNGKMRRKDLKNKSETRKYLQEEHKLFFVPNCRFWHCKPLSEETKPHQLIFIYFYLFKPVAVIKNHIPRT